MTQLSHAFEHRFFIVGQQTAQVNDLQENTFSFEYLCRLERGPGHGT